MSLRPFAQSALRASARPVFQNNLAAFTAIRQISYIKSTPAEAEEQLKKQRAVRPVSPHLTIYQPQLTWYLSSVHRVTGVALAGAFYAGLISYVGLPLIGSGFDSSDLAIHFGNLSEGVKTTIKAAAAFPFTFHAFNGIRHMIWDTASELTIKGVYRTGYAVLGLTTVSSIALAFFL
ncbi:cytochrome b560 subunit of succinate dehydrogenase [Nadsonia fulvescens var. elongata DSM 6958]|uniref:Cytochrome b560 subunit of succinate dehydrogenase n=1 Tax=Nadsonia fulvescens var. elongata DSM 6958 TaxID=857566 RepID=A0A1E3PR41_9ASCO|nr:cytochrome b560 subunit of succinate dehydrogenase [Nadsonia fulvescens var. elongata DSM 6958]